jgi:N-acetylglucosaminyldiphosphoundecaprenol N-acetyl-beta-D-mannosaminyltransferase
MNRTDITARKLLPPVRVLGALITPLDLHETISLILEMFRCRGRGYICIANTHTATLALRDGAFRKALNGASAVVADGVPVLWRVRAAGHRGIGRVHGADLIETTCAAGISEGLRHGFLGGLDGVAEAMVSRLRERYRSVQIAGVWNPGIIRAGEKFPPKLLDEINAARCDVLWVGLGAPKQEFWMAQHRFDLQAPAIAGVGQAFDIIAGRTNRPPAWMGSHGLEWLYRLVHEPRRLWKRYAIYNSLFLWYLVLERFGYRLYRVGEEKTASPT